MNEELVSIIIPVHNCEKYIERTLNSVFAQTYKNIEVIIVDDGSKDGSKAVYDKSKKEHSNLKIYFQSNSGVSSARNLGIAEAKGKYIYFMDSDDYIEENTIFDYVKYYKKYPDIQIVVSGYFLEVEKIHNGQNKISQNKVYMPDKFYDSKMQIKEDLVELWDKHLLYNVWNKLYLKSVIVENKIRFPDYNWGEDIQFNRDYFLKVDKMINLEKCYYHYIRAREGAVTNKYIENLFDIRVKEFFEFNEYFEKYGISEKKYIEFSCRRYIERTLGCIENLFIEGCKLNFWQKYNEVKRIIYHEITIKSLNTAKIKSKKVKIMLVLYKFKMVYIAMIMGKFLNIIKSKFPALFNKLKYER